MHRRRCPAFVQALFIWLVVLLMAALGIAYCVVTAESDGTMLQTGENAPDKGR